MPLPSNGSGDFAPRPADVGIVAIEFYAPREYVEQAELEIFDGHTRPGKYTQGLGQTRMAICSDREDIHSICLTVVKRLFEKNNLSPKDVGFLMVGTETLLDKSKSVKSVLMQLFVNSEDDELSNYDVAGVDTTNACFGGTAALLGAMDWVNGADWDGRYAIVVCGDIAVYAEGVARPTGGAGAIAMLIGPNAPLVIDKGVRTHFMKHTYDFYKPDPHSEYPTVDGSLSVGCYMEAVFKSYGMFRSKFAAANHLNERDVSIDNFDGLVFHAPYCKIVSKALARIAFSDFLNDPKPDIDGKYTGLDQYRGKTVVETATDRDFEQAFTKVAADAYATKLKPSLFAATEVGNMYTASVYACLVSFLASKPASDFAGKRVLVFSYGSGLASAMFSISLSKNGAAGSPLDLLQKNVQSHISLLSERLKITPEEFDRRMKEREEGYGLPGFVPKEDVSVLFPGTYYLNAVDDKFRRTYSRKPLGVDAVNQKKVATPVIGVQGLQINGNGH